MRRDPGKILGSIGDRWIRCLMCGKEFEALGRHVRARHGVSPDEYRRRFGLNARQGLLAADLAKRKARITRRLHEEGRLPGVVARPFRGERPWFRRLQAVLETSAGRWGPSAATARRVALELGEVRSEDLRKQGVEALLRSVRAGRRRVSATEIRVASPAEYGRARALHAGHGGLLKALAREGITVTLPRAWSRAAVVEEIGRRARRGGALHSRGVQREEPGLYWAAARLWRGRGSWNRALKAAGIELNEVFVGHRRKWTRDRIMEKIRRVAWERGSTQFRRQWYGGVAVWKAARDLFGGWPTAVRAAGLKPYVKGRGWTQEGLLQTLRVRSESGKSLSATRVREEDGSIYKAARRFFRGRDGWARAVEAALAQGGSPA